MRKSLWGTVLATALVLGTGCGCPSAASPCPCATAPAKPPKTASALPVLPTQQQCQEAEEPPRSYEVENVDDVGVLRLYADAFVQLTPQQRVLAYWLSQAAIAGEPILYDQRSHFGLTLKSLAEEFALHIGAVPPALRPKVELFAKKVFLHKGLYDAFTGHKWAVPLDASELQLSLEAIHKDGAKLPGVQSPEELKALASSLGKLFYDPNVEPVMVATAAGKGKDVIALSASTYYEGLTLKDLSGYSEKHPLNARLVKRGSQISEMVYRAGRQSEPSVAPGLYAAELGQVVQALRRALAVADEPQRKSIEALIGYLEAGEHEDFVRYHALLTKQQMPVDLVLGFLDTGSDPRRVHGEYEAAVLMLDKARAATLGQLAKEAAYFEQRMPWAPAYKRTVFGLTGGDPVVPLTLTGSAGPVASADLRLSEKLLSGQAHAAKSYALGAVGEATHAALLHALSEGFWPDPAQLPQVRKCGPTGLEAFEQLHSLIGHGSGKVSASLKGDSAQALKELGPVLEEAKADLVALHALWDPKVQQLGLLPEMSCAEVASQSYPLLFLLSLRTVSSGERLQDDSQRAQSLVVRYALDKGALRLLERPGQLTLVIADPALWRATVDELLAEVMRIKAEGDYAQGKALIDKYGTKLVPLWRDNVQRRVETLRLPAHFAFLSPRLKPLRNDKGEVVDATIVDSLSLLQTALVDAGKQPIP